MDFSNIARQLNEGGTEATDTAIASSEKAKEGGAKQVDNTIRRRESQKAHMSQQQNTPVKSDVSYASEQYRAEREYTRMMEAAKTDWRQELMEAVKPDEEGNHPYVDVMPFMNQKAKEAKQQIKGAAKMSGDNQAKMANESLSVEDQMKVSQDYFKKRNARPQAEKASQEKKDASARAKNSAANRNNNIGQMDHSKRND